MEYTFKKRTMATESWGRGKDQQHTSAQYSIMDGSEEIGFIYAHPRSYMEPAEWYICAYENGEKRIPRPMMTKRTLREAKAWINARLAARLGN